MTPHCYAEARRVRVTGKPADAAGAHSIAFPPYLLTGFLALLGFQTIVARIFIYYYYLHLDDLI
jgi:hypothetical protein